MAEFGPAFDIMIKNEGFPGYVNDPSDHGGETCAGIARKFWRGWRGWQIVDEYKNKPGFPKNLRDATGLFSAVQDFYKTNFWTPAMEQMPQEVATWLFDKSVNMGSGQAKKLLQRALGVTDDGQLGIITMTAIKNSDPVELVEKCREQARAFYRGLVDKNPSQAKFLSGWLARA